MVLVAELLGCRGAALAGRSTPSLRPGYVRAFASRKASARGLSWFLSSRIADGAATCVRVRVRVSGLSRLLSSSHVSLRGAASES